MEKRYHSLKSLSILCLSLFILASCSKDDDNDNGTETGKEPDKEVEKSDAKAITAFSFLATDNEALSEDVKATIDKEAKTITATVPFGAEVKALKPTIELSEKATVDPNDKAAADFSEAVTYTVTAEDDSKAEYTVTVTITAPTEREVLVKLFNVNPDNRLGWDIEDDDMSNWEGVTLENGKVTELNLSEKGLTILPKEIGSLSELVTLYVFGNGISEIPKEIGNLENLEILSIGKNFLSTVPNEIWNLRMLKELFITQTRISSIPPDIENLTNLERLVLSNNRISSIPREIGNLTKLRSFLIDRNRLDTIPKEICDLNLPSFSIGDAVCEE
ncbi:leucine-rich repeat domain-containing protein [Flagellimonas sp. 389]|uniref:leucine-rich repeat domain-containing protein n=1 Tax=Flagellimonas sp. 389 TaxID=2835862 RepID=UPI001BD49E5A|nr:leucine-rich repeat domain-containing protein [Flagellimonas sp. 389]MBS9463383.1 leucine-rich repeat domain-containing protein [Flagellimonas sp. 389]